MKYELRKIDCENPDFLKLCEELDNFLNSAIGGEEKREKYKKFNHADTMDYVIIAYVNREPAGCGALRKYSDKEIEVKRVFVRETYRRKHIGSMIIEALIMQAEQMGFQRMILETGVFLSASVHLYQQYGFEVIENYGAYQNMPESLCMGRDIGKEAIYYCRSRQIASVGSPTVPAQRSNNPYAGNGEKNLL